MQALVDALLREGLAREGEHAVLEPGVPDRRGVDERVEHARRAGEQAAEEEGEGDGPIDVDPHDRRG